jgi:hypothetical protein
VFERLDTQAERTKLTMSDDAVLPLDELPDQ